MKDEEIYKLWEEFINDNQYKKYFEDNKTIWLNNLSEVKKYIDINNKRPSDRDKDVEIKRLAKWIGTQQENYKNKEHIMKDEGIKNTWFEFIEKYKKYFEVKINKSIKHLNKTNNEIEELEKELFG